MTRMTSNTVTLRVCKRVKPDIDGCILLDIDTYKLGIVRTIPATVLDSREIFGTIGRMGLHVEWLRYDRTTHGWHVIIKTVESLSYQEILCAQSILGDDPKRAAYNFKRLRHGVWLNQLFEPNNERNTIDHERT